MELVVPVDDRGYQTKEAGKYAGMYYAESNGAILADMKADSYTHLDVYKRQAIAGAERAAGTAPKSHAGPAAGQSGRAAGFPESH